ncbi:MULTISPECIES: dermonecrotic toxin domain-containing protein [unclassified Pseudomonas]|uniref:dermonecrotic toxin domain-containing protein n=1 Tax=unclassified Pseudomonas TaxID=196821 RepID=UPI000BCE66EE|nr:MULTISPECIES: DUF6543 domain-containing protein [unclassified Pseudomonas]PVZ15591.1 hypothetical protein F474_02369 [Pseudomonas sp. URIL14HWK12:I12]PVZ24965.1 hypothetical protein F470_02024 [Pseudomonas sp. URIL14HWK12:I10]PVZ34811.1 hypothetical protein F472_02370 [Pseudomonas sp. URIL14HWK12:I11]SNZ09356.1 hypothetical protein SAMN05660463_01357 [Pseudomonas sp. URIL14HWK12:I9]
MRLSPTRFQADLLAAREARATLQIARDYFEAWPDLYTMAYDLAARCVLEHTGKAFNPDKVWWHCFERASNSAKTFTGWQHAGPPIRSMTLTELVVRRFDDGFQDAPQALDSYSGFYQQDAGAPYFDERNEVPLLPSTVMAAFWSLDFAAQVRQRTQAFWEAHGTGFILLAKVQLLAAARQAELPAADLAALYDYCGADVAQPLTLQALKQPLRPEVLTVARYENHVETPLFTLTTRHGSVLLYSPAAHPMLRGFDNASAMTRAIAAHLASPQGLSWANELSPRTGGARALAALRERIGTPSTPSWPFGTPTPVQEHLLQALAQAAHEQLIQAQAQLVDNQALRRELWRGYLGAFLTVFAPLAPLGLPLSIGILAAGAGRLVLDVQALTHARLPSRRREALVSIVADTLLTLFSIADLGLSLKALRYRAPAHEQLAQLSDWQPGRWPAQTLDDLRAGPPGDLHPPQPGTGPLQGVRLRPDGSTWISLDEGTFRVRYDAELRTWLAVRPDAPYAFAPLRPVQLNADGQWAWLAPPRLAGGAPTPALPDQAMWATYMADAPASSRAMAVQAIDRQRGVLANAGLPQLPEATAATFDSHGYACAVVDGQPHYTYSRGGQFNNDLVRIYTSDMHYPNHLFRFGIANAFEAGDGDLHAYLKLLFDSLDSLPGSNGVTLWRGGHGLRNTSGAWLRSGQVEAGDTLVTTDITSFTENPYALKDFVAPRQWVGMSYQRLFDDTSVVFELPAGRYHSGKPVGPLSMIDEEAETLFSPGRVFRIDAIKAVEGETFRFTLVRLRELAGPVGGNVFDLRTGTPFDRAAFAGRIADSALLERLFPAAHWA